MLTSLIRRMYSTGSRVCSNLGPIGELIKLKVEQRFADLNYFAIHNDSYRHKGHSGIADSQNKAESHFRLEIVTDEFKGMNMPKRHRLIYSLLQEELTVHGVHALQLITRTTSEHAKRTAATSSTTTTN